MHKWLKIRIAIELVLTVGWNATISKPARCLTTIVRVYIRLRYLWVFEVGNRLFEIDATSAGSAKYPLALSWSRIW